MAELLKVREIKIDTMQYKDFATKEEELKLIRFYQNDLNSAKLLINVTHDKVVTDFSTATKVQIAFLKPDGKRVFQDVQNVNQMQGKYYVVLSTQTLIAYGNVIAQLRLTFPNNKVIETCKFVFAVDESIMSDEAMESTNEFPVIQKAIEAGEKLEGVDINGIIAAGELAKGALPKTGGTMTGHLDMEVDKNINFKGSNDNEFRIRAQASNNKLIMQKVHPTEGNKFVWEYQAQTDTFTMNSNTNLLKKTGDTMTGNLGLQQASAGSTRKLSFHNELGTEIFNFFTTGPATAMRDVTGSQDVWTYSATTKTFNLVAPNTNLVKSTGDTMTGNLSFNRPNATTYQQLRFLTNGVDDIVIGQNVSGKFLMWDQAGNSAIWEYDKAAKSFNVTAPKTNIVTKDKDGKVVIPLTSDATPGSITPQLATRRGNTVTLNLDVIRNAGATGLIVANLPADMCPTESYAFEAIAVDGTPSRIMVRFNGEIYVDAPGKRFRMLTTYVVN